MSLPSARHENEVLQTYEKVFIDASGKFNQTSMPWDSKLKVWTLQSDDGQDMFVMYNPQSTVENPWWCSLVAYVPLAPRMRGEFWITRGYHSMQITEAKLRRQLVRYLKARYKYNRSYTFSYE